MDAVESLLMQKDLYDRTLTDLNGPGLTNDDNNIKMVNHMMRDFFTKDNIALDLKAKDNFVDSTNQLLDTVEFSGYIGIDPNRQYRDFFTKLKKACHAITDTVGLLWKEIFFISQRLDKIETTLDITPTEKEPVNIPDPDCETDDEIDLPFICSILSMVVSFICFIGIFMSLNTGQFIRKVTR